MKRGKGPKADPEKTRAWQQRSRERAAANARGRSSAPPNLAVPDVDRFGQPGARRVEFRARTPAREHTCFKCKRRKAQHWHHWSPQSHIRAFVRAERIRELRHEAVLLRRLLRDERNLSPVCAGCHGDKALGASRLTREDVPASAFEFAMEMGAEWLERLRGLYPSRRDSGSESEED